MQLSFLVEADLVEFEELEEFELLEADLVVLVLLLLQLQDMFFLLKDYGYRKTGSLEYVIFCVRKNRFYRLFIKFIRCERERFRFHIPEFQEILRPIPSV